MSTIKPYILKPSFFFWVELGLGRKSSDVSTFGEFMQEYQKCEDAPVLRCIYRDTCEGIALLGNHISKLERPEEPDQLVPFIDPTTGLRSLGSLVGSFGNRPVHHIYFEQGVPHVASGIGAYEVNLEEMAQNGNIVVIHSSDEETSKLSF